MKYMEMVQKVDELNKHYKNADTISLLSKLDNEFPSLTLVSSFGAESAVLLHLVSLVNKEIPIIFIDTGKLFKETLDYKETLEKELGLKNIQIFKPQSTLLKKHDPKDFIHKYDADLCCHIRKVEPLSRALKNTDVWISGRKRFQTATRSEIPLFEIDDMRIKINLLANWTRNGIKAYFEKYGLPEHPLVADNYLSIGCMPCTTAVKEGEDIRSGRWRGQIKTECGIHTKHNAVI